MLSTQLFDPKCKWDIVTFVAFSWILRSLCRIFFVLQERFYNHELKKYLIRKLFVAECRYMKMTWTRCESLLCAVFGHPQFYYNEQPHPLLWSDDDVITREKDASVVFGHPPLYYNEQPLPTLLDTPLFPEYHAGRGEKMYFMHCTFVQYCIALHWIVFHKIALHCI